ncbi:MAG: phosphoserine phosphatase SerB [Formosimonas sp.]
MKIICQHPSALSDALIQPLFAPLTGQLRRISPQCVVLEHTLFDPALKSQLQHSAQTHGFDIAFLERKLHWSDFKLLAMDMDSTVINIECIDEIADMCGKKTEVAAITEAAMRGEITDFDHSLRLRLAILAGVDATVLERVLHERLQLNDGAERLIQTAHAQGLETLLVSGGFTFFTNALQKRLGLTHVRANQLEIVDGKLTGQVIGEIINGDVKAATVRARCDALTVPTSAAICMGDGANDVPMMRISGLSVAHHAKPRVQAQAMVAFNHMGLDGLLPLMC